jgi:pimeloyl-ACP methyl ester carboxylesterase
MRNDVQKPYFMIGHSFAGAVIAELIKLGDSNIKGAVFVDCVYQGFKDIQNARVKFARSMLTLSDDALRGETIRWYSSLIAPDPDVKDRELILTAMDNCDIRWLFQSVAGCEKYNSAHPPEETPVHDDLPIFITESDNHVGADFHTSWVNHFRNARYYLFEDAYHFFFVTQRERFNALLEEFIVENCRAGNH